MTLSVEAIVICDEIRKEITGKDILIGVYGGGIAVQAYPATFNVALWMLLNARATGSYQAEIKIDGPSGNPPIQIAFGMDVGKPELSSLGMGGLPIRIERDGELTVSFRQNDAEWTVVAKRTITRQTNSIKTN